MYDDRSGIIQPHEPLEEYRPGGFHPVTLGDTFRDERYSIRHKLGFGGHSTVWLAWDGQDEYALFSLNLLVFCLTSLI